MIVTIISYLRLKNEVKLGYCKIEQAGSREEKFTYINTYFGWSRKQSSIQALDQLNQNHAIAFKCSHRYIGGVLREGYQFMESIASRKGLEERNPKLVVRSSSSVQKALLEEIQIGYHLVIIGSSNARFVEKIIHSNLEEDLLLDSQNNAVFILYARNVSQKSRGF